MYGGWEHCVVTGVRILKIFATSKERSNEQQSPSHRANLTPTPPRRGISLRAHQRYTKIGMWSACTGAMHPYHPSSRSSGYLTDHPPISKTFLI